MQNSKVTKEIKGFIKRLYLVPSFLIGGLPAVWKKLHRGLRKKLENNIARDLAFDIASSITIEEVILSICQDLYGMSKKQSEKISQNMVEYFLNEIRKIKESRKETNIMYM